MRERFGFSRPDAHVLFLHGLAKHWFSALYSNSITATVVCCRLVIVD
jgi:hypothetical protein